MQEIAAGTDGALQGGDKIKDFSREDTKVQRYEEIWILKKLGVLAVNPSPQTQSYSRSFEERFRAILPRMEFCDSGKGIGRVSCKSWVRRDRVEAYPPFHIPFDEEKSLPSLVADDQEKR
jgi:hypothetical protein